MFNWIDQNILSLIIFTPLAGAVVGLFLPSSQRRVFEIWTLFVTLLTFVLSLHLVFYFDNGAGYQFAIFKPWIQSLGVQYALAVDGISLWLVVLTTFLMPIVTLFSWGAVGERHKAYYLLLLILHTGMLGAFMAVDAFFFYLFWEAMLIPMYFLIGIYGHGDKIKAATKFFIYTVVGSVLMLLGMIYLYFRAGGSFLLQDWLVLDLSTSEQWWLFLAFTLSFAIKVPIFPLHTWLPEAHTQAPAAGSVILAGVLLKMGTYGLVRFAIPLFPQAYDQAYPVIASLAVVGIIYGSLVAMVQKDIKKLIAYSSIAHLGFVVLGLMAFNEQSMTGAVYQMLNHGVSSGALFLLVGMLYTRTHTQAIANYGGLAKTLPLFTFVFMVVTFSSIALPGTNGFVGEFMILAGTFYSDLSLWAIVASLGVILSAVYMLWMVERVFFGKKAGESLKPLKDLNLREWLCILPLLVMIVWMGLKPNFFLEKIEPAVKTLVEIKSAF
ncbi:MAG: NADH-quinone oxidoreductase subunit M [Deltaproteobacteria bacterium]|nr:NADH-quinone oxidoreductase subunit M [Deltaproteobacteria bacterium]